MASARDRAHFQAIAEADAEANASDLLADALRSPGDNIKRGLRLGDDAMRWAARFGAVPEVKVALTTLWRQRKAQAKWASREPAFRRPFQIPNWYTAPEWVAWASAAVMVFRCLAAAASPSSD